MFYRLVLLIAVVCAPAQDIVLAPKPISPTKYVPPHRPHTKLADVLKRHASEANWTETVVDDDFLHAAYVFNAPGTKTPRRLHPDTREWWVLLDGQIRYDIEKQQPFVASKGSMVQVPLQTFYSLETIGDKPSLRFEVNIAHARTIYAADEHPPTVEGFNWIPVRLPRRIGVYERGNRPHVTFEELARNRDEKKGPMTQRVVEDDRGVANFIYGRESELPPLNPKERGHYHAECAEFWLIMAGQIRYPIENQGVIIASEGDVVYVPKFTFHAPRFHGPGPSCRLAMNGFPNIAHLFDTQGRAK